MFWAHEPNRPVASPNSRSTPATPSPAKCSRKRLKGRRVACSWRPCARSCPTIAERCRRVVCCSVAPLPSKANARAPSLLPPALSFLPCSLLLARGRVRHGRPAELAATAAPFFVLAANHRTAMSSRASTVERPRTSFAVSRHALELRRRRAVAGRRRLRPPVRVWPSHLGLPPAQPSSPMDACGPTGARAALLLGPPPPALACRGWPLSQPPDHVAGRPWATSGGATTGFGCASTPRSSSAASSPPASFTIPSRPSSPVLGCGSREGPRV